MVGIVCVTPSTASVKVLPPATTKLELLVDQRLPTMALAPQLMLTPSGMPLETWLKLAVTPTPLGTVFGLQLAAVFQFNVAPVGE